MSKAHYIIFHPDYARQLITVTATAMIESQINPKWTGDIFVDRIGNNNEDPFVFNDPWLYSYCHASQLKRKPSEGSYLQVGSKIIFASGDEADNGFLSVDTFFVIGEVQNWFNDPALGLPTKYNDHFKNNSSNLWRRHFRFPFYGIHKSVSHTYEAELWQADKSEYSFLPYDQYGAKVSISFDTLNNNLANKITSKVWGKYPVLLSDVEIDSISNYIEKFVTIKILGNIKSV